jgi:hypothetical protein
MSYAVDFCVFTDKLKNLSASTLVFDGKIEYGRIKV